RKTQGSEYANDMTIVKRAPKYERPHNTVERLENPHYLVGDLNWLACAATNLQTTCGDVKDRNLLGVERDGVKVSICLTLSTMGSEISGRCGVPIFQTTKMSYPSGSCLVVVSGDISIFETDNWKCDLLPLAPFGRTKEGSELRNNVFSRQINSLTSNLVKICSSVLHNVAAEARLKLPKLRDVLFDFLAPDETTGSNSNKETSWRDAPNPCTKGASDFTSV
ncbi:unnamed protein product, partial [Symbiodinium microadriaticum]